MNASTPRPLLLAALLTASPTAILSGCEGGMGAAATANDGTVRGTVAPALAGKTIDGEYVALSDFRGQVVLVNVWATWCPPCKKELPELARLHDKHGPNDFTVFAVSVDKRQHLPRVHEVRQRHGLTFPMLFDPEGRALAAWEVSGYPTSVLVGRDGTIRWRRNGIITPDDPELRRQIASALAEPRS